MPLPLHVPDRRNDRYSVYAAHSIEREPILPSVENVKVTPELAEDDLERFRDALVKGGYESWMQLFHDLGYKEKEYKWGCQYILKARVAANGSLIRD